MTSINSRVLRFRVHLTAIAVLVVAIGASVALPTFAAAADTFTVNSTGDAGRAPGAEAECRTEASAGECTLRAAIEAADFNASADVIQFAGSPFDGVAPGATITAGSELPTVNHPLTIDGGVCPVGGASVPCVQVDGSAVSGHPVLRLTSDEATVEHLAINGGSVGIKAIGSGSPTAGVEIVDNTITGTGSAIETMGSLGSGPGNVIAGNLVQVPGTDHNLGNNFGLAINNGPNQIFGNELTGSCCFTAIWLMSGASGNRIGGDSAASENVISGFQNGAISLLAGNEVGRNRGTNGFRFISGGATAPPTIDTALQSSVRGTAEPGATVRVFRMVDEFEGSIDGFLEQTVAAAGTGGWEVTFPKAATGTFVAATQTLSGSTSNLSEVATLAEEPEEPEEPGGGGGGGENGGGGGTGGGGSTGTGSSTAAPAPVVTPPPTTPTAPEVKITSGPKKSSTATTAKFRFRVEPAGAAGATYECKLDKARWAKCSSPKAYKQLKPGRHTFRVRASAAGPTGSVAAYKFTVRPR